MKKFVLTKVRRSCWTQSGSRLCWSEPVSRRHIITAASTLVSNRAAPLMGEDLEKTYSRDGVGMSRQRFQTLPRLHVPYPDALIELDVRETNTSHSHSQGCSPSVFHSTSYSPSRRRWGWTGGWSCSRTRSCCDLLEFSSTFPGLKRNEMMRHFYTVGKRNLLQSNVRQPSAGED